MTESVGGHETAQPGGPGWRPLWDSGRRQKGSQLGPPVLPAGSWPAGAPLQQEVSPEPFTPLWCKLNGDFSYDHFKIFQYFYSFHKWLNSQNWDLYDTDVTTISSYQFLTVTKPLSSYMFVTFSFIFNYKVTSCLQTPDRSWSKCLHRSVTANFPFFF